MPNHVPTLDHRSENIPQAHVREDSNSRDEDHFDRGLHC